MSGVLQVDVVLIRPEPVDFVVPSTLSQYVACGDCCLSDRVLPMLHSDSPIEYRVIMIRDVAGGVNIIDARLAVLVDHYAILDPDPAAFEQVDDRLDADPDDSEIAFDSRTARHYGRAHAPFPLESFNRLFEHRANAMPLMKIRDALANGFAKYAKERRLCRIDRNDLNARVPEGCGDLGAYESHADDDRSPSWSHFSTDASGIPHGTKTVDTLQIATWN